MAELSGLTAIGGAPRLYLGRFAPREDLIMAKVLKCGDLMPGCKAVLEGKDEAEVMAKGAAHAKQAHNIATIPPEMAAKVKAAIKDK
jgi:predicted small metal-binding protein